MAQGTDRTLRWGLLAALGIFFVVLVYIVVTQSGLLPGDTGDTAAVTTAGEETSGGQLGLAAWPWGLFLVIATVVLGGVIAYGQYKSSKATRAQLRAGEEASHKLYAEEDRRHPG